MSFTIMTPSFLWKYFILSIIVSAAYFHRQWEHQQELYWAIIALLNTRVSLFLVLNLIVTLYTAIVVSIHAYFFGVTKEGERFVGSSDDQGNSAQGEVQANDTRLYARVPVYEL